MFQVSPAFSSTQSNRAANHTNGNTGNTDSNDAFPLAGIPFAFQLDDIQTNFATMNVILNTTVVPANLKPYLQLFIEVPELHLS